MEIQVLAPKKNNLVFLVASYILLILGYSFNHGLYFHQSQLWLLLLSWLCLFSIILKKDWLKFNFNYDTELLIKFTALISFILFYFFDTAIYLNSHQAENNILLVKFFALLIFLLYFVDFNLQGKNILSFGLLHFHKFKFYYLIGLAIILRLLVIYYSPAPRIDVYFTADKGANYFFSGINPYSQSYNLYSPQECLGSYNRPDCTSYYAYLPAVLFSTAVSKLVFGDIRFIYLFSSIGMAFIIYLLAKNKSALSIIISELLAILVMFLPLSLFVLEQSWIDYLVIFLFYTFVLLQTMQIGYLSYIILALFFLTRITMLAFLPFVFKLRDLNFKKFLMMFLTAVISVLPFVLFSRREFLYATINYSLGVSDPLFSMSFLILIKNSFYTIIPNYFLLTFLMALLILIYIRSERGLRGFVLAATTFLMAIFLFKRGFANYYFSIASLIILLITLELSSAKENNLLENISEHE